MAIECELAALFFKWRRIDLRISSDTESQEEKLEIEFRKIGGILEKLDATAELLVSTALDAFLFNGNQKELVEWIQRFAGSELSQGSIKKNIQEKLFWPRNQILHFGRTDFAHAQAEDCLRAAIIAMKIYQVMDQQRASRL